MVGAPSASAGVQSFSWIGGRSMIDSVLTTAVTVSDMERSLAFYRDLLGFRVAVELPPPAERDRWDAYHRQVCGVDDAVIRVVYMEAPDGQTALELIEYTTPKRPPQAPSSVDQGGTVIIAMAVSDSETAVARARAAGVESLSDPIPYVTDDGASSKTTYLRDPDGTLLCFFEIIES